MADDVLFSCRYGGYFMRRSNTNKRLRDPVKVTGTISGSSRALKMAQKTCPHVGRCRWQKGCWRITSLSRDSWQQSCSSTNWASGLNKVLWQYNTVACWKSWKSFQLNAQMSAEWIHTAWRRLYWCWNRFIRSLPILARSPRISTPIAALTLVSNATCATTLPMPDPMSTNTSSWVKPHAWIIIEVPIAESSPALCSVFPLACRISDARTVLKMSHAWYWTSVGRFKDVSQAPACGLARLRSFEVCAVVAKGLSGEPILTLHEEAGSSSSSSLSKRSMIRSRTGVFVFVFGDSDACSTGCCVEDWEAYLTCCFWRAFACPYLTKKHGGNLDRSPPNRFLSLTRRNLNCSGLLLFPLIF